MTTVKEINHDSSMVIGDFYSSVTDLDGAVTVTAGAALDGSVYGVNCDCDLGVNAPSLIETFTAIATNEIRFRARANLDNATLGGVSQDVVSVALRNGNNDFVYRAFFADDGSGNPIVLCYCYTDIGITVLGPSGIISGDSCFEVRGIRETADGNNDGIADFYVNGGLIGSASNLQNFNRWVDGGAIDSVRVVLTTVNISGDTYYDELIIDDDASVDLGCSTLDQFNPMSVDAAGEYIYVALLDTGLPILTKISTALNADGVTVFNPGGGNRIGVECGRFNSDVIWVAGQFGGTDAVEKSEDGGASFTVKDDGTIGSVRTFAVGPDSDNRILVFDETNGAILETRDGGTNWTTINATVTPEVNAIGRFGKNVQETAFGNQGAANNNVDYSVNSGADLEDFVLPVNQDVTGVIVN